MRAAEKVSFPFPAFYPPPLPLFSSPLPFIPFLHFLFFLLYLLSLLLFFISFLIRPSLKCQIGVKHDKYGRVDHREVIDMKAQKFPLFHLVL